MITWNTTSRWIRRHAQGHVSVRCRPYRSVPGKRPWVLKHKLAILARLGAYLGILCGTRVLTWKWALARDTMLCVCMVNQEDSVRACRLSWLLYSQRSLVPLSGQRYSVLSFAWSQIISAVNYIFIGGLTHLYCFLNLLCDLSLLWQTNSWNRRKSDQ